MTPSDAGDLSAKVGTWIGIAVASMLALLGVRVRHSKDGLQIKENDLRGSVYEEQKERLETLTKRNDECEDRCREVERRNAQLEADLRGQLAANHELRRELRHAVKLLEAERPDLHGAFRSDFGDLGEH